MDVFDGATIVARDNAVRDLAQRLSRAFGGRQREGPEGSIMQERQEQMLHVAGGEEPWSKVGGCTQTTRRRYRELNVARENL